jgi:hypothetical protein
MKKSKVKRRNMYMSKIIDVLIVFDFEGIKSQYPNPSQDPEKPTPCDHKFIFMISSQDNTLTGNGGAEQKIKAKVEDNIRWRLCGINPSHRKFIKLEKFKPSQGETLIEEPEYLKPKDDGMWESTVLLVGNVTYHWTFQLKKEDETTYGYFTWDPFIEITE